MALVEYQRLKKLCSAYIEQTTWQEDARASCSRCFCSIVIFAGVEVRGKQNASATAGGRIRVNTLISSFDPQAEKTKPLSSISAWGTPRGKHVTPALFG